MPDKSIQTETVDARVKRLEAECTQLRRDQGAFRQDVEERFDKAASMFDKILEVMLKL